MFYCFADYTVFLSQNLLQMFNCHRVQRAVSVCVSHYGLQHVWKKKIGQAGNRQKKHTAIKQLIAYSF